MYLGKGEAMVKERGKGKPPSPFPARSGGERSEPERSAGNGGATGVAVPSPGEVTLSPEVDAKPVRRRFTTEYKLRILREAEACSPGGIGAILRREGLYASHLTAWRRQQEAALSPQKRGRRAINNQFANDVARLEKENRRLAERLRKAEIIIHVQKKLCDVLGLEVPAIPEIGESE